MSETLVDSHPIDSSKRTWLIASSCAGAVGVGAAAIPFVSTFQPSERAKAAGAAVEVDIGGMKPGDISKPVLIGNQAIVVFRLKKREIIPPFEQIKEQMYEQATEEAVMRQRDLWVLELRRGVYLDIRLN